MAHLDLRINLDNAEWRTETDELDLELFSDALRCVAELLRSDIADKSIIETSGKIEINGNQTGEWSIKQ